MKKVSKSRKNILESMMVLVSEGESLACYKDNDFSEFAEVNGYDLKVVEQVYSENEEKLNEIWEKANETN